MKGWGNKRRGPGVIDVYGAKLLWVEAEAKEWILRRHRAGLCCGWQCRDNDAVNGHVCGAVFGDWLGANSVRYSAIGLARIRCGVGWLARCEFGDEKFSGGFLKLENIL